MTQQQKLRRSQIRSDKPHPVDFKELKMPLLMICNKVNTSFPNLVRMALKEWINNNHPEVLESQ